MALLKKRAKKKNCHWTVGDGKVHPKNESSFVLVICSKIREQILRPLEKYQSHQNWSGSCQSRNTFCSNLLCVLSQIINADVFKCLQEKHGESYEAFMLNKLVPVVGNVCESNLALEGNIADLIVNQVDVIVNSAANTTFDERYL